MKFGELHMPPSHILDEAENINVINDDAFNAIRILDQIGNISSAKLELSNALYYLQEFDNDNHSCFIARNSDGDICAAADYTQNDDHAYIQGFAVDRAYREAGIGARFIDYLGHVTRERGLGYMALQSVSSAVDFYRKVGFSEYGVQAHPNTPVMRKLAMPVDLGSVVS